MIGTLDDLLAEVCVPDELEPVSPPASLRARVLLAAVPEGRLARFAPAVAELLAIDVDTAAGVLDRVHRASAWHPLVPGAETLAVATGLGDGWRAIFVRMGAGSRLPRHGHVGRERSLVLQGSCIESSQPERVVHPGESIEMESGSSHEVAVCDGPDLLFIAAIEGGVTVD